MAMIRNVITLISMVVVVWVSGCASNPSAETWRLPAKQSADSAMIIGRIGPSSETKMTSDMMVRNVVVQNRDFGVYFNGNGEECHVMDNNYYVIPNIKPGRYNLKRFLTDNVNFKVPYDKDDPYVVKPGQIIFLGSMDFTVHEQTFGQSFRNKVSYDLKKSSHPTELEMLYWLRKVGSGSGWEKTINKRIQALGGK